MTNASAETRPLAPKHRLFVDEYMVDLNATQAYIRAGYSPVGADRNAYALMRKHEIASAIAERRAELAARIGATQERVLMEYARIAFADMRRFATVGAGGVTLKSSEEWTDDDAAVVAEVSETVSEKGGSIRFKLHSKVQALDALARHLGLFAEELPPGETLERLVIERRTRSLSDGA